MAFFKTEIYPLESYVFEDENLMIFGRDKLSDRLEQKNLVINNDSIHHNKQS
ncbi:MAG: hypothetical protein SWX82_00300 [Cyanobacteriota bacterium]|nr:hypothetical protein [Cyanobacteriota bacterium]